MKTSSGFALLFAVLLALFTTGSNSVAADDVKTAYVDRTIRLIVGYGTGGGYDAFARLIAPELARETGASVVVQNKPIALARLWVAGFFSPTMINVGIDNWDKCWRPS